MRACKGGREPEEGLPMRLLAGGVLYIPVLVADDQNKAYLNIHITKYLFIPSVTNLVVNCKLCTTN